MALTDSSIAELVRRKAAASGGVTILRKKDRGIWKSVSWAELGQRVDAMAGALQAAGIVPGDVVGVLADISPEFISADLGILSVGGVALALMPSDSGGAIAHCLAETNCVLLFVEGEEQLDKALGIRAMCPALRRIVIMDMKGLRSFDDPMSESLEKFLARRGEPSVHVPAANDIAVIAYTSGTSGAPKPVRLSHANIMAQIATGLKLTGVGPGDERLAFLPMALVVERIFGLYLSLASDTISNLVESVETVPENLAEVRPTMLIAPPRVWQRLASGLAAATAAATALQRGAFNLALQSGSPLARRMVLRPALESFGLDRLRCAWVGGASSSAAMRAHFRALGVPLQEFYGLVESGGLASLGAAIAGMELRIADGEIMLRGPLVASVGPDGWLGTGDLGAVIDGKLRIDGRISEQFILQDGATITPALLENALRVNPFIADALVFGAGQQTLCCIVMVEQDALEQWAQARDLPPGNFAALVRAPEVRALLQAAVDEANKTTSPHLHRFVVIDRRLEPGDAELTPMMRLRRDVVVANYPDLINEMFDRQRATV